MTIRRLTVLLALIAALSACARDESVETADERPPVTEVAAESVREETDETPYGAVPGERTAAVADAPGETTRVEPPATVARAREIADVGADAAERRSTSPSEGRTADGLEPPEGDPEPPRPVVEESGMRDAFGMPVTRRVSPAGLYVTRAYVCKGIDQREPTEAGKSFIPEDDGLVRLCCFSEVSGAARPDTVLHLWYWGDREMARVALPVKSFRWRTWSKKKILDEWRGEWRIDIADRDGFVMASLDFSVE